MNIVRRWSASLALFGALGASLCHAQATTFSEDFTGANTVNSWYFFSGACLTAGTSNTTANPGLIPSCTSMLSSYYSHASTADPYLVGGNAGYLGSATPPSSVSAQVPDPPGSGALRFTNGSVNISGAYKYGFNERGAILSSSTFPTGAGIQVTFKTITYHGNSGGTGGDGADGISFFLQDGSQAPGLGAFGGSLAYSCSNSNTPHDGLVAGYIGLGIDEYGNFLNGTNLVSTYTGTNTATGDNSAYGYGFKPGRIGLRGAGNVSWTSLNSAYGANPANTALPYYPVSLTTSCANAGGVYSSATQNCIDICSAGSTYDSATNVCNKACTGSATYSGTTDTCNSCPSGTYNSTTQLCTGTTVCAVGTYYNGTATCETCPAAGYATGTYSSGTCIHSCPAGYAYSSSGSGYCYPTSATFSSGYYCASGNSINGQYCYPTGAVYSATYYCAAGNTITGQYCYPTGDSYLSGRYCPSGQTISGTSCYPTGDSHSGTNYCPSGQTITGTSCYPTGSVYASGYYCPTGNVISTTHCCPTGYAYSAVLGACTKSGNPNVAYTVATPVSPATAMSVAAAAAAATAATAATAAPATQTVTPNQSPTSIISPTETPPATLAPTTGNVDSQYAVQKTCANGTLYNYTSASAPTGAGTTTLDNTANSAGILDYAPIPNAYTELTSFQIANEGAVARSAATPIFYSLKITQDGLLSFAYSVSGGAYSYLIRNQSITASNGPLPTSFRVGFAGSDGRRQQRPRDSVLQGGLGQSVGELRERQPKRGGQGRGGYTSLLRLV